MSNATLHTYGCKFPVAPRHHSNFDTPAAPGFPSTTLHDIGTMIVRSQPSLAMIHLPRTLDLPSTVCRRLSDSSMPKSTILGAVELSQKDLYKMTHQPSLVTSSVHLPALQIITRASLGVAWHTNPAALHTLQQLTSAAILGLDILISIRQLSCSVKGFNAALSLQITRTTGARSAWHYQSRPCISANAPSAAAAGRHPATSRTESSC